MEDLNKLWDEMQEQAVKYGAINFTHGNADFDPPSIITEALKDVLVDPSSPFVHQYTRRNGHLRLVNILAQMYSHDLGIKVDPLTNIIITAGAQHALYCALSNLAGPNDEMILFEPFYPLYSPLIHESGVKAQYVRLNLNPSSKRSDTIYGDFMFHRQELESKFNKRTKIFLFNNPNNPSGKVFSREEMDFIAGLCMKHDVIIFSDEVYFKLVHPPKEHIYMASLPGMWERTLTIGSVGKFYSVTGWKTGWCIGPENIINAVARKIRSTVYNCVTPIQEAVAIAFEREQESKKDKDSYLNMASKDILERFAKVSAMLTSVGMVPIVPEAGYFLLADISNVEFQPDPSIYGSDVQFCKWMLMKKGISTVPLCAFLSEQSIGPDERYIRLCFYKSDETLKKAEKKFKEWSASLEKKQKIVSE